MLKVGDFKEGDVVRYVGAGDSDFYVKVGHINRGLNSFSGEVVYIGGQCEWYVGHVSEDWWRDAFILAEGFVEESSTQLQQKNTELEYTIETLKQRLIEAERNALYWTAFDCPVNRDIAERILRKEG